WWGVDQGSGKGGTILYPDSYIIIRNNSIVARATVFSSSGDVEYGNFAIPLTTRTSGKQDNHIAVPRPVAVALKDLGLNDNSVFSISPAAFNRMDELLVFDNSIPSRNKAPT